MKTRIIQTSYWDDEFVVECGLVTKLLFIYLLSCSHINQTGIFQLRDDKIIFETGIGGRFLPSAKKDLSQAKKVIFESGWVYVVNAMKYNGFYKSLKNLIAYQKEIKQIPETILKSFDTSINSSIITDHKSKIITYKEELKKQLSNNLLKGHRLEIAERYVRWVEANLEDLYVGDFVSSKEVTLSDIPDFEEDP